MIQKIDLPIKKDKKDDISPNNPDFGWFGKMILIIALILLAGYILFHIFSYLGVNVKKVCYF